MRSLVHGCAPVKVRYRGVSGAGEGARICAEKLVASLSAAARRSTAIPRCMWPRAKATRWRSRSFWPRGRPRQKGTRSGGGQVTRVWGGRGAALSFAFQLRLRSCEKFRETGLFMFQNTEHIIVLDTDATIMFARLPMCTVW